MKAVPLGPAASPDSRRLARIPLSASPKPGRNVEVSNKQPMIFSAFHCTLHESRAGERGSCLWGAWDPACLAPSRSEPRRVSACVLGRESMSKRFPVILLKIQGGDERQGFGLV